MILYFTGTGNSRFLAHQLGNLLHDTVVDATDHIQKQSHPAFQSGKPYVFVSPTYAWRLPRVFETWIRKCSFAGSDKAYYVLNCGSDIGAADEYIQKLSADIGFRHMGTAEIPMPENYIALFSAPGEAETETILNKAEKKAAAVARVIRTQQPFTPVKINALGHLTSGFVNDFFYKHIISAKKFYVTDGCISCGKCVTGCMLNNITLKDGKPVWGTECTHCMACICKCPVEAIEYGKHSKGLRRYTCPKD